MHGKIPLSLSTQKQQYGSSEIKEELRGGETIFNHSFLTKINIYVILSSNFIISCS